MEIAFLLIGLALGGGGGFFLMKPADALDPEKPRELLKNAEKEAERVHADNREKIEAMRRALEAEEKSMEESFEKMDGKLCLDTDFCIEIIKGNASIETLFDKFGPYEIYITSITMFELF